MGVIRVVGIACTRCGERNWYVREPEKELLTGGNLLALALAPLRILDASLSYLMGSKRAEVGMAARMGDARRVSEASGHARQVKEGLKAEALRNPKRVKGVHLAPGETACASCDYRTHSNDNEAR